MIVKVADRSVEFIIFWRKLPLFEDKPKFYVTFRGGGVISVISYYMLAESG